MPPSESTTTFLSFFLAFWFFFLFLFVFFFFWPIVCFTPLATELIRGYHHCFGFFCLIGRRSSYIKKLYVVLGGRIT